MEKKSNFKNVCEVNLRFNLEFFNCITLDNDFWLNGFFIHEKELGTCIVLNWFSYHISSIVGTYIGLACECQKKILLNTLKYLPN